MLFFLLLGAGGLFFSRPEPHFVPALGLSGFFSRALVRRRPPTLNRKTWFSTKFKVQGCSRFKVLVLVSGFRIPGFRVSLKISRFQGFRVYNSGLACVAQPTVKAHPPAL